MSDSNSPICEVRYPVALVESTPALLARAQERARNPKIFEKVKPYFMRATVSNNLLDSYYTKMAPSTLKNYANDFEEGVSVQDSHKMNSLGFGRSLTGRYIVSGELQEVYSDFFTVPGLDTHSSAMSSDDFIIRVETGIAKDVSVGFYGAKYTCSICKRDLRDYECRHIPGMEYTVTPDDQPDAEPTIRLAFAWVNDAHAAEFSAVSDGATPGCAITKAYQEAEAGRINRVQIRFLEERFRCRLPGSNLLIPGFNDSEDVDMSTGTGTNNNDARTKPATIDGEAIAFMAGVRSLLQREGVERPTPLEGVFFLAEEVKRLRPLADDGSKYKGILIEETIREGIRARGNEKGEGFKKESYEGMLKRLTVDEIRILRDDWRAEGDARWGMGKGPDGKGGKGGATRMTRDEPDEPTEDDDADLEPDPDEDMAYMQ